MKLFLSLTRSIGAVLSAIAVCLAPLQAAAQTITPVQNESTIRFAYERDEKIAKWMRELVSHIIYDYLDDNTMRERGVLPRGVVIDYTSYANRAKKMVKRARKKWGDEDRDTIYVSGIALLVFINYRLKISDISVAEARELVPDALIAPPREIFYNQPHAEYLAWKLAALHDLTAARVERFGYNGARSREYYNSAIEKFEKLDTLGLVDGYEIIEVILTEMSHDMEANRYLYE